MFLEPRSALIRSYGTSASVVSGEFDQTPRQRRILAAFASPEGRFANLNLEREKSELSAILQGVSGLALDFWERARLADLQRQLAAGADIFHSAGHGDFDAEMGAMPFTIQGQGALIFPCHREIRKLGAFGQYRYGPTRKRALLAWEQAQTEQQMVAT